MSLIVMFVHGDHAVLGFHYFFLEIRSKTYGLSAENLNRKNVSRSFIFHLFQIIFFYQNLLPAGASCVYGAPGKRRLLASRGQARWTLASEATSGFSYLIFLSLFADWTKPMSVFSTASSST